MVSVFLTSSTRFTSLFRVKHCIRSFIFHVVKLKEGLGSAEAEVTGKEIEAKGKLGLMRGSVGAL